MKIWKDQRIRSSLNRTGRRFGFRDLGNQSRVRLQFSIDNQFGCPRFDRGNSFADAIERWMFGTALRRKRQEREPRLRFEESGSISRSIQRNIGKLVSRGYGNYSAI